MGIVERREKERQERREAILNAASRIVSTEGFDSLSMARIAETAELAKGTVYLYFRNRTDLLMALLARDLKALSKLLRKKIDRISDPGDKLVQIADSLYQFSVENECFYKILTGTTSPVDSCDCDFQTSDSFVDVLAADREVMSIPLQCIEEGVENGIFFLQKSPIETVITLIVAVKGSLVVMMNRLYPAAWEMPEAKDVIHDVATMLVESLKSPKKMDSGMKSRSISKRSSKAK